MHILKYFTRKVITELEAHLPLCTHKYHREVGNLFADSYAVDTRRDLTRQITLHVKQFLNSVLRLFLADRIGQARDGGRKPTEQ